jgi:hypothetical protein
MKRQAAILGATPEFVRWSIRHSCRLRHDTEIGSIDQTEKRLRAIRTAGAALQSGKVFDGVAVSRDERGCLQGFRLDDIFHLWGGQVSVQALCHHCPANLRRHPDENGQLAGCCGWLAANDDAMVWRSLVDRCWPDRQPAAILTTRPRWYGLWAAGHWTTPILDFVIRLFVEIEAVNSPVAVAAREFRELLTGCRQASLGLDVELVPAGFSTGVVWTIPCHCDRCRAPYSPNDTSCPVCKKGGRGHPEIKRRVLGHRPWVPLEKIVGQQQLADLGRRVKEPGC